MLINALRKVTWREITIFMLFSLLEKEAEFALGGKGEAALEGGSCACCCCPRALEGAARVLTPPPTLPPPS